jgi:general secretion pathway protein L
MALSLTSVGGLATGFLSWWLGELKAICSPFSRLVTRGRPTLTLSPLNGQWALQLRKGGRVKELSRVDFGSPPDRGRKAVRPVVKNVKLRNADLKILLSNERTLRRTLEMPSLAEPDLRQALSFEIERQTPFKTDDVYFDYRILTRDPAAKHMIVELITVPRAAVDSVLKEVRNWGLQPSSVDIAAGSGGAGLGINLLRGLDTVAEKNYLITVLFVLLLVLSFTILFIPVRQLASLDKSLEAQLAKEQETAKQTLAMRSDLVQEVKSAQFLDIRKKETLKSLVVLNELTRVLPDNTWLMTFQQNNSEIKISGYSTSAARLISVLDDTSLFKDPSFTSSIVQDKRQQLERFELKFKVDVGGRER